MTVTVALRRAPVLIGVACLTGFVGLFASPERALILLVAVQALIAGMVLWTSARRADRHLALMGAALAAGCGGTVAWAAPHVLTASAWPAVVAGALVLAKNATLGVVLLRLPRRLPAGSLLDGLITASGTIFALLGFVGYPVLTQPHVGWLTAGGVVVGIATDLLLITAVARMVFGAGPRAPGVLPLTGGVVAFVVADSVATLQGPAGGHVPAVRFAVLGWTVAALLVLCAARHERIGTAAAGTGRTSAGRIITYLLLIVVAPLVSLPAVARLGTVGPVPAAVATLMTGLMVWRLVLLLRLAERRGDQLEYALQAQQHLQSQVVHRATHDLLTGLGNRQLLEDELTARVGRRTGWALLFVDIDRFQDCNDRLGSAGGDALLQRVAEVLRTYAGAEDVLVRTSADEFAVLLGEASRECAQALAGRIVKDLADPLEVTGRMVHMTVSVGAVADCEPRTASDALRDADIALHAAKTAGGNRATLFEPALRWERLQNVDFVADLRRAVGTDEFRLHYQPIVDLETDRVTSVEALARWHPPGREPVSPLAFIPAAEQHGLIVRLGEFLLAKACEQARAWHERYGIAVTVNVSGQQLRLPDFADVVFGHLARTGLPPAALTLEITESELVTTTPAETAAVNDNLSRLRAAGVRVAIDDFGTGYSSLSYLGRLPIDVLKVDRSFVQQLAEPGRPAALARAVVQVGRSLGFATVAEGVETVEQAAQLRAMGCRYGQGYLYARPLPPQDLEELLSRQPAADVALSRATG